MNLTTELEQQKSILASKLELINDYTGQIKDLSDENSSLKSQVAGMASGGSSRPTSLEDLVGGTGGTFSDVVSLKLSSIKNNRLKKVIYIKEVTRPAYINTFMIQLLNYLNGGAVPTCKNNIKMVIFDNRSDFAQIYNPLPLVNSSTYFEGDLKDRLHKKNAENIMVFTDLNPVYIQDLATKSEFDNLIIYDRLGKEEDLLFGGAVVKFYAFGSNHTLAKYTERHSEIKTGDIIINAGTKELPKAIEIHYVEDYRTTQAEARKEIVFKRAHMNAFKLLTGKCGY
jgi:hypothetical protein